MNANDHFAEQVQKAIFEVDISVYRIGACRDSRLSTALGREKMFFYFFRSSLLTSVRLRTTDEPPDDAERRGDFSPPAGLTARSAIIDPLTGQAFPNNVIPQNRIHPMGQQMLNLLPLPNGVINQASGQQFTSNDAQDTTPIHKRRNFIMRVDGVLSPSQRISVRSILDRDDSIVHRVAPGVGPTPLVPCLLCERRHKAQRSRGRMSAGSANHMVSGRNPGAEMGLHLYYLLLRVDPTRLGSVRHAVRDPN